MSWIAKLLSREERDNGAEKPKIENLHMAEIAKQKIEKVIEKPIVRELFQTDDDLGYC
ncbi:MAG: hypothetical protein R2824_05575 [Saprospiraceae bacterium]|nr:hypothetical protein [Lewinella sp.]